MKPNFSLRLRIFNLNCWGIPYLSKHRADRMRRLGDFLNQESFDLALLEEVWSEQDFQYLRQKLSPTYPAAHHFRRAWLSAESLAVASVSSPNIQSRSLPSTSTLSMATPT